MRLRYDFLIFHSVGLFLLVSFCSMQLQHEIKFFHLIIHSFIHFYSSFRAPEQQNQNLLHDNSCLFRAL